MKDSTDYKPNLSRGILVIGEAGKGKTTLLARFPGAYIIDCDNNLSGADRYIKEKQFPSFKYDIVDIDDVGVPLEEGAHFRRLGDLVKVASADPSIKVIVIDSLTKLSDYVLADILKKQGRAQMQLQDWGTFLATMKLLITRMRSTKKMFGMTAHTKAEKDDVAGFMKYKVLVPGQLQEIIATMFSDVWLAEVVQKGDKYLWQLQTMSNTWYALKNSFGFKPVITHEEALEAVAKAQ